jgi:hypothetical protein
LALAIQEIQFTLHLQQLGSYYEVQVCYGLAMFEIPSANQQHLSVFSAAKWVSGDIQI